MAKQPTFIQAAVPLERGPARHIEHSDDTAFTQYRDGKVEEIHTPGSYLKRIHEVMHARHSNMSEVDYPGVRWEVAQIVEDCRLHLKHWPWPKGFTPEIIKNDARTVLEQEVKRIPTLEGFGRFATGLRAVAVQRGISPAAWELSQVIKPEFEMVADEVLGMLQDGQAFEAACILEKVFFSDEKDAPKDEPEFDDPEDDAGEHRTFSIREYDKETDSERRGSLKARVRKSKTSDLDKAIAGASRGGRAPQMDIIELERVEMISSSLGGMRVATSGPRIYRPALRRPVLPQRLFIKRSPVDAVGVVLFDASGSMDVSHELLNDCCRRAPTAAVGYYSGNDSTVNPRGQLVVYAKDGMRAREILPPDGGNSVDGPALDWLMSHDAPRIMVTDKSFCGSPDSTIQLARLERLIEQEEVVVYPNFDAFKKVFPASAE